ncbi:MAG: hypothetical protein GWP09_00445, partial [Nitrospiraceae bacterium]|nr:hypothetical protein [Nitrospiraceae bacterium]
GILAFAMVASAGLVSASPMHIEGSGSGILQTTYNNGVYNDVVDIESANFSLITDYNTNTVTRDFQIKDSYNYIVGGCSGHNPIPNAPDFGSFTTTDLTTNDIIHHDMTFEKRYAQYPPAEVKLTQNLNFATKTMSLYSRVYAEGDWSTTQQFIGSDYSNYIYAREYNRNSCDKMYGDTDFLAGTAHFDTGDPHVYVPKNVEVYVGDNSGASMTGNIGGVGIDFTGNLYHFDHTNIPTNQGFNLDIQN